MSIIQRYAYMYTHVYTCIHMYIHMYTSGTVAILAPIHFQPRTASEAPKSVPDQGKHTHRAAGAGLPEEPAPTTSAEHGNVVWSNPADQSQRGIHLEGLRDCRAIQSRRPTQRYSYRAGVRLRSF